MTVVGGDSPARINQTKMDTLSLAIGARLLVEVLGQTRHGLAVRAGTTVFSLNAGADFPAARHATLQVTARIDHAEHKVKVLALDDRPPAKPLRDDLILRSRPSSTSNEAATAIGGRHPEIRVQPIDRQGRPAGAPLVAQLSAIPPGSPEPAPRRPSTPNPIGPLALDGMTGMVDPVQNGAKQLARQPPGPAQPGALLSQGLKPIMVSHDQVEPVSAAPKKLPVSSVGSGASPSAVQGVVERSKTSQPASPANAGLTAWPSAGPQELVKIATVVGHTVQDGRPLLDLGDDLLLRVDDPIDLPTGATLQLIPITTPVHAPTPWAAGAQDDLQGPLEKLIRLLEDIQLSGDAATGEQDARADRQLPMPDRHLAKSLLHFLGLQMDGKGSEMHPMRHDSHPGKASRSGDLQGLLLDIGQKASEHLTEGWRGAMLPFGPDPSQALMIYHRGHDWDSQQSDAEGHEEGAAAQRAIFDLSFSHLGRCQIDALCQDERFDIVVRSEKPLDHQHQETINGLYADACEIAGFQGTIGYQHGHFVDLPKASPAARAITT